MIEATFLGRGGQGVVLASQILGQALFLAGWYPQAYSMYGGERRGAPVRAFLRLDRKKIRLKCEILKPDHLIVLDASLLDPAGLAQAVKPGGLILVNFSGASEGYPALPGVEVILFDAQAAAGECGLGRAVNTAMLGAYAGLTGRPDLESLLRAVAEMVPSAREENACSVRLAHRRMVESKGS